MTFLILLEDEPVLCEVLSDFLTSAGYCVTTVETLARFREEFRPELHRIAVIDLGLPDGDGLDLIGELRDDGYPIGIIALTARASTEDKVAGLARGADHYLPKTIDLPELAATIDALGRRLDIQRRSRWILQAAPRQLVPCGHPAIPLSGQDYTVLLVLAQGQGGYVTREAIINAFGEDFFHYDQRRLDTQMRRLRRKVEAHCVSAYLYLLRGRLKNRLRGGLRPRCPGGRRKRRNSGKWCRNAALGLQTLLKNEQLTLAIENSLFV